MAKLLIVVDMQNDFVKGHMSTPEAKGIIGKIKEKVDAYQARGHQILFTMDTHRESDYAEAAPTAEAASLPKHCIQGTDGWRIVDELLPYAADCCVEKPTFLGLELAEYIREIRDTPGDTIELCGVCTDICVLSNALYLRARYPRATIAVDSSCCAGVTPEAHAAALLSMKSCLVQVE